MYTDPNGNFPLLTLAIISGILIVGGGVLGGVSDHQNGTNVWEGIGKGMCAGAMLSASIILTVGSFYVPGCLGSNLGLMMFSYGYTTAANMLEVGITQARYSMSKGESWSSNITNAMFTNSGSIYGIKGATKMLPFAQHFTWHIGEKYTYTVPGMGGAFHDYYTTGEAWGFFKEFLARRPSRLSYIFASYASITSTYQLGRSIFGDPNYSAWILY